MEFRGFGLKEQVLFVEITESRRRCCWSGTRIPQSVQVLEMF